MSSTIFFYLFIPLLAFILLSVNLIFAPHNAYMEKNSVFECGFSSFLGQNRTQFSISFFIFALLFLLFDLEILLVYPYLVSAYTNGIYGLTVLLLFLLALTLGFAFELGKKALSIDSRQISNTHSLKPKPTDNISLVGPIRPKGSKGAPLQSGTSYMAVMLGLAMDRHRAVESVDTIESTRLQDLLSQLPTTPTHDPGSTGHHLSQLPPTPTHDPGSSPCPGSSSENSTIRPDLLTVSKEETVKYEILKTKLLGKKSVSTEVDSPSHTEQDASSTFGLDNFLPYLKDSSEKYLSLLNELAINYQSTLLVIITLASLISIFTFLLKLIKILAKFVKLMFKSINEFISKVIPKKNKKTNITLSDLLVRTYILIICMDKVSSSPNSDKEGQGQSKLTWVEPETIDKTQSIQNEYPQLRWASSGSVSGTQDMKFNTNTGKTLHRVYGGNPEQVGYVIPTSETNVPTTQTDADASQDLVVKGSIE